MFILDDILHQIICPLLDLNSLINLVNALSMLDLVLSFKNILFKFIHEK